MSFIICSVTDEGDDDIFIQIKGSAIDVDIELLLTIFCNAFDFVNIRGL